MKLKTVFKGAPNGYREEARGRSWNGPWVWSER